ncbi:MAG: NADH-quinone oxidoreductase subunit N [Candidatus Omnitrophica bacterium]|nr:NADH-quinone oxidoreductase subunit N [Candidatus Omnitrophota bacterium]
MMNLRYLLPEWVALGVFILLLIAEILKGDVKHPDAQNIRSFCITSLLGSILVCISTLLFLKKTGTAFGDSFIVDPLSAFFKLFFILTLFMMIPISYAFFNKRRERLETFLLILWCTLLGMFFLASANDLFVLFLCIEIITLSFYIMAAYLKHELPSIESGLKYLIIGSLASAFLVFGIALIYAAVGSTNLPVLHQAFVAHPGDRMLVLGMLFIIAGLGFKIGAVPFHLWVPDVYEGAPIPTVAFLSVGSKAAGIFVLLRLLFQVFVLTDSQRALLFSTLSALTMICGNFGALKQTSLKRLLGYSSIAHAGYLLIGFAVGYSGGITGVLYYLLAYAAANLTIFLVMAIVDRHLQSDRIEAYAGLAQRSPILGACFFIALLSLAGVPGTAGFFGKFLILLAAVHGGFLWLTLLGLVGVVVSLYYYLSVVRVIYAEEPAYDEAIPVPLSYRLTLILLVGGIFVLGLFPAPFLLGCYHTAFMLFQTPLS